MKNIICLVVLFIGVSFVSLSQDVAALSVTNGEVELVKSAKTGVYQFQMPENCTAKMIEKRAGYYTRYFTVSYNESTSMATVKMNEGQEVSKPVIARFLSANGVKELKVDDDVISMSDFIDRFLK